MPVNTYDTPLIVVDERGRRYINRDKLGENFYVLRADQYPIQVSASSQGIANFSVPEDAGHAGDFEVGAILGMFTAPCTAQMSLVGVEAASLQNVAIHHQHFFGNGELPFVLSESLYVPSGKSVQVVLNNLSSATTAKCYMALVGRRFNADLSVEAQQARSAFFADRPTLPFSLGLDTGASGVSISAGSTKNEFYATMPSGSHLAVDDIMLESTGIVELALYDGAGGKSLTFGLGGTVGSVANNLADFIDSRLITGNGNLPHRTIGSPLLQPRRSIRVVVNDLAKNGTNKLFLTFHGRRLRMPVG